MQWQTDIGLEIHIQLKTNSKLFSSASTKFGEIPNANTSFIDAGFPGTLPVLNAKAVELAVMFALATSATINNFSYFERKNYFYPDLPKGYQITQNSLPIISGGHINILLKDNSSKSVSIHHAHLEEDAGKLIHSQQTASTYIDLNRAGNPLLEVVTNPCLNSAEEVITFLKEIHNLVKFLNISDGNMQEGSFRCDINISIRPKSQPTLGTKTEIKNLNSFKFIEKAINFEIQRQQKLLIDKQKILQETRLYCPDTNKTYLMRSKENAADYRYFKEPDLQPIIINAELILQIKNNMPKLPQAIRTELLAYKVNHENISFVLNEKDIYDFFEKIRQLTKASPQKIVNFLKGPFISILNANNFTFANSPITPEDMALLLDDIVSEKVSNQTAKLILAKLIDKKNSLSSILAEIDANSENLSYDLHQIVEEILTANPEQVQEYKTGKEKILAFLIGQVLKRTNGQADAQEIKMIINNITRFGVS